MKPPLASRDHTAFDDTQSQEIMGDKTATDKLPSMLSRT